jgi:hypothetical protein
MLDKGISVAIMLFILSMISERFVTWVKIYFGKAGRSLWILFNKQKCNLRKAAQTKEEEKSLEVQVLGLNIVLSIMIALAAHADLFNVFSMDDPYKALGWSGVEIKDIWNFLGIVSGCMLTGLFISLGSKFWHDLLDLLLYAKNLKAKLSDPQTYDADSIDQLTEYLSFTQSDLVKLAIEQNSSYLQTKFPNINFLNDSVTLTEGERKDVLCIYLRDNVSGGIPEKVPVKLPSGKTINVATEVVTGVGYAKVSGGLDGPVANKNSPDYKGSGCCIAEDNNGTYLVTNGHVPCEGDFSNPLFNTGNSDILYGGKKIGDWYYGSMSTQGDFALVRLTDPDSFKESSNAEAFNGQLRDIDKKDYFQPVTVRGQVTTDHGTGYIIEVTQKKIAIQYNYGQTIIFDEAILLGNSKDRKTCGPASDYGDSGGAVYDDQMRLIGIITGIIDNRFTVVIPLRTLVKNLSLKIY